MMVKHIFADKKRVLCILKIVFTPSNAWKASKNLFKVFKSKEIDRSLLYNNFDRIPRALFLPNFRLPTSTKMFGNKTKNARWR